MRPIKKGEFFRIWGLVLFLVCLGLSGCGFYFKTYRYTNSSPFAKGMSEGDLLQAWGNPLSVSVTGPMTVWQYAVQEPQYGQKTEYYLVWLKEGQVVKWGKKKEERVPPGVV